MGLYIYPFVLAPRMKHDWLVRCTLQLLPGYDGLPVGSHLAHIVSFLSQTVTQAHVSTPSTTLARVASHKDMIVAYS